MIRIYLTFFFGKLFIFLIWLENWKEKECQITKHSDTVSQEENKQIGAPQGFLMSMGAAPESKQNKK